MVVIWNTSQVVKGGQISVVAKAHTDVDIKRMRIAAFDDTRFCCTVFFELLPYILLTVDYFLLLVHKALNENAHCTCSLQAVALLNYGIFLCCAVHLQIKYFFQN